MSKYNPMQNKFLEKVILKLPDLVFCKDLNGVYLACNEAQARVVGLSSADELIGKTDFDILSKEAATKLWDIDRQVIAGQLIIDENNPIEEKILLPDGQFAIFEGIKVPLHDNDGTVIGLVGTAKDVTKRKQMEKDLLIAMKAAQEASQAKSEFIANMSHDIRTPLTGILGLIQELINTADDMQATLHPSVKKEHDILSLFTQLIEKIQEDGQLLFVAADELTQLLNEILETMRLESGKVSEKPESFNLHELIHHNIELLQPVARHRQLAIFAEIEKEVPIYYSGLRNYLNRTLLNLMGNALKFTEKGFVKIAVTFVEEKSSSYQIGDSIRLQLTVEDTGIGIPEDKFETIFEHFSRLSPSYQGLYKGAGLGLFTVKRYVEAMQGEIKVESTMGKGTRFIITFPLTISDHSDREKISYRQPSNAKVPITNQQAPQNVAYSILIVEDNYIAAKAVQTNLKLLDNCTSDIAPNGTKAIEMVQQRDYDLVLMDIGLPDINGIEVTRRIRALNSSAAAVQIVALTGHANDIERKKEALAAGMQDVFAKPLSLPKLETLLEQTVFHQKKKHLSYDAIDIIDWEANLQNFHGDEECVRQLLTIFSNDLKVTKFHLDTLIPMKNYSALQEELHKLHGSIIYVSVPALKNAQEHFQEALKETPIDPIRLEQSYAAFVKAMEDFWSAYTQDTSKC